MRSLLLIPLVVLACRGTPDARKLADGIVSGGQTMKTLTELTETCGPRLTGSASHVKAAAWAAARFRAFGVDAKTETFSLDHTWARGEARGNIVAPTELAVHVASMGWTPGTPPGGVRGVVLELDDVSPAGIARRKDEVKGRIVYYGRDAATKAAFGAHPMARLAEAGALAVVAPYGNPRATKPNNVISAAMCPGVAGAPCAGPAFAIGLDDGEALHRLLEKGPVTMELASTAILGDRADVPIVVGEIRGREKPEELVLLGAHLDAWDFATGAQDDGSGVAQVLEAARAIRALGTPPRRTIRFLLWGGEEQVLLGSRAYARAHASELPGVVAYLNSDYGAGAPHGWNVDARPDAMAALSPIATTLLAGLSADRLFATPACDTDACPFWAEGVPALELEVDRSRYGDVHHLPTDTIDRVNEGTLAAGAAVMAVTAYALAEMPDRFAPRASHAALAATLGASDKGKEAMAVLVDLGLWKP